MSLQLQPEDLDTLREIQTKYSQIALKIGHIILEKHRVQKHLNSLGDMELESISNYESIVAEEEAFHKKLLEQFGSDVQVNLETGEVLPAPSTEE